MGETETRYGPDLEQVEGRLLRASIAEPASPAQAAGVGSHGGLDQTPGRGTQAYDFTPPPAPFAALKQRQKRRDLKVALERKSLPLLSALLLKDSSICNCNAGQEHVLHAAVESHDPEALEFILKHGMKDYVNIPCGGQQPLHRAVRAVQREGDPGYIMAESLLEHRAMPDRVGDDGSTPLHEAAANVSLASVSLLLKHNASLNVLNTLGQSALHLACQRALFVDEELQSKVVDLLLAKGADPSLRDYHGFQPLDHAEVPMLWSSGSGETELCQQLRRAIRWQARRQAFLIRCKGDGQDLIKKLPDAIFRALIRFV
jgi:ankyrin repeat protein